MVPRCTWLTKVAKIIQTTADVTPMRRQDSSRSCDENATGGCSASENRARHDRARLMNRRALATRNGINHCAIVEGADLNAASIAGSRSMIAGTPPAFARFARQARDKKERNHPYRECRARGLTLDTASGPPCNSPNPARSQQRERSRRARMRTNAIRLASPSREDADTDTGSSCASTRSPQERLQLSRTATKDDHRRDEYSDQDDIAALAPT